MIERWISRIKMVKKYRRHCCELSSYHSLRGTKLFCSVFFYQLKIVPTSNTFC